MTRTVSRLTHLTSLFFCKCITKMIYLKSLIVLAKMQLSSIFFMEEKVIFVLAHKSHQQPFAKRERKITRSKRHMCFLYTLHVCQLEMITNNTHALSSITKFKNPFANELRVSRNLEQRGSRHWQVSNGCIISQFSNEFKKRIFFFCVFSFIDKNISEDRVRMLRRSCGGFHSRGYRRSLHI